MFIENYYDTATRNRNKSITDKGNCMRISQIIFDFSLYRPYQVLYL